MSKTLVHLLSSARAHVMHVSFQEFRLLNSDEHAAYLKKKGLDPAVHRPDVCHQVQLLHSLLLSPGVLHNPKIVSLACPYHAVKFIQAVCWTVLFLRELIMLTLGSVRGPGMRFAANNWHWLIAVRGVMCQWHQIVFERVYPIQNQGSCKDKLRTA